MSACQHACQHVGNPESQMAGGAFGWQVLPSTFQWKVWLIDRTKSQFSSGKLSYAPHREDV